MKQSYYKQGDWKAQCDQCGRAYKGTDLREQWDGAMTCFRCYDSKHPDLDPIIAPREDPMVSHARPRSEFDNLTFVNEGGINIWGGMLNNGHDYNEEFYWEQMDINWNETTGDNFN